MTNHALLTLSEHIAADRCISAEEAFQLRQAIFPDGVVSRQVCFNWSGNQCAWNAQVDIVACPDFYLYHLPNAPVCNLRYCGTD